MSGSGSRFWPPPTRHFVFSGPAFHEGIETHELDGAAVRIYDPEKTVADGFRYRNQIGMDVVLEAMRFWRERRSKKLDALLLISVVYGSLTAPQVIRQRACDDDHPGHARA